MTKRADADPERLLPLHPLEFRILLALLRGNLHGYHIVKQIEAQEPLGRRIFPANLYRRMRDLLAKGLIAEAVAPAGGGDERRRYFRLTPLGRRVVEAEAWRLQALVRDARREGLLTSRPEQA